MLSILSDTVDALCDTAFHIATAISFLLERALSQLHSTLYSTLRSLSTKNRIVDRAWWDTKKGSAVVIWCPGDQTISEALAISLASIRAKKGLQRAGRPPYTVLIVLSSGLPSIISSWANRKAKIEEERDNSRGRSTSTIWDLLSLSNLSIRLGSPESSHEALSEENDQDRSPGGSRYPLSPGKKRRLSFGNWSASDVVGFGKDMLKGLRIGQAESQGIGAVIPVFADTSTLEGVTQAQSTIKAYCTSHDLLLRALIVVPSLMGHAFQPTTIDSPTQTVYRSPEVLSPSSGSLQRELASAIDLKKPSFRSTLPQRTVHRTQVALAKDVSETLNVLASLLPFLKADGGRVVALVPSAWRSLTQSIDPSPHRHEEDIEFNTARKAILEMWSSLKRILGRDGVNVSQVHMCSAIRPALASKSLKGASPQIRQGSLKRRIITSITGKIHHMLYPTPHRPLQSSLRKHDNSFASLSDEEEEDDVVAACPHLLLDSIRSILIRSWPRSHYCIGLGPRLEGVWSSIPGNGWIRELII